MRILGQAGRREDDLAPGRKTVGVSQQGDITRTLYPLERGGGRGWPAPRPTFGPWPSETGGVFN